MTKEEKLARKQQRKAEKVGLGKLLLWNSSSCSVALSTLMLGYVTFYCTDVHGKILAVKCRHGPQHKR